MNSALEQDLREINEALLVSSVRQHELAEQAQQAEAALRISEAQLRQIADSMPQMVWTARPDGFIDYYNERWYEYTGFPRDEFGQSSWEPILHSDDVQPCVDTYFRCIREGTPFRIEYRFKDRAHGGYRWFMGRALPIRDEQGEIARWFGTCTDIDDQKRAEERLRQSHAELQSHTEELARFNCVAVGRESRMIELKKEVNELRQGQGQAARYPLEFKQDPDPAEVEPPSVVSSDSLVPLESVLCTEELSRRPTRPPDHETESRALAELAQALADSPHTILQTLAERILQVFQADSAGISLLTKDKSRFYWPAIAGVWRPHVGGGTPRNFGPCGDVLDRNAPLLFRHPERRYTYFQPVTPPVEECLLIPFYVEGQAVGTIWAIAHDGRRKFDAEDLRQLESLGRFASAAYQAVETVAALAQRRDAALNLMEDAVQMERDLHDSELRYRRLFESAKDGILILDAGNGKVIDANPFLSDLLGYSEFVGKELWEIGLFQDKSANEAALRELRDKGYLRYEDLPLQTNRGQRVEVEVIANAYREDDENVIQCNIRDTTDRSRLEKVAQEQANALADLHRRKDEFLAMLSHELRNPLAPILNAVQLLRLEQSESGLQQQARTIIERQVGQLSRLIDDLLEVSRISTGRIHLHEDRLDLRTVVERAVETVRSLIGQRRHALTIVLPPAPIWLHADATRLEQVVVNLLNNAAKYTPEGGQLWVGLQQEANEAVLRVKDTGEGIAADVLPRIFDLFTQAERSLDRSQGGLGIGLALVKTLVEMHRGRVEACSTLGQGSEFVVRLPVLLSSIPLAAPPVEKTESASSGLRVLVVDDNLDAAHALAMLLKLSGHDTRMAHTGPAALQEADAFQPHVVLLDIGLPQMNGYEVARRMRQQPRFKDTVLVALTGYGQESDRQLSKEAGFDQHLVKPADFGKLKKILASASEKAT